MIALFNTDLWLLQNGWTALHMAAQHNRTEVCLYLIEKGADLAATDKVTKTNSKRMYIFFSLLVKRYT